MRRLIVSALALLTVGAIVPAVSSATVVVENAVTFSQQNGDNISGWWWLRQSNASATWTFSAANVKSAKLGTVYLQFSPLVTNRPNGGSGYRRSIKVTIKGLSPMPPTTHMSTPSVSLYNPFRPTLTEDTHGVGYQTYGWTTVSSSIWRPSPLPPRPATTYNPTRIQVTVNWTYGYHFAVKSDSVRLAYAK